jgi:hypothetical protein
VEPLDISLGAGEEIVDAKHLVALIRDQSVASRGNRRRRSRECACGYRNAAPFWLSADCAMHCRHEAARNHA